MAQGLIGGATAYDEQSLNDILVDIQCWIEYTNDIKKKLDEWLTISKESGFWKKVDYDFQLTIYSSISYFNTIIDDLRMVKGSIEKMCITQRDIILLRKIGRKAIEYNNEYPRTYKSEKRYWHDYGNPDFEIVEKMYAKGRDYFVTLQDAGNAAARLEDYMNKGEIINNTMNISGSVTGSQIQQGTINSTQGMINDNEFPYEKIADILKQIEHYSASEFFDEEFRDKAEEVREIVNEVIKATEKKEEPSKIKRALEKIKGLASGVGSGIIANGIFKLLESVLPML